MVNNQRLTTTQPQLAAPNAKHKGSSKSQTQFSLTVPALNVISINIEGFSNEKAQLLSDLCDKSQCDVLCVQETHRNNDQLRPEVPGMILIAEIPHPKYGSAVFVRSNLPIVSACCETKHAIEVITIDTGSCTVTSVYKPPNSPFIFNKTNNFEAHSNKIIIGDFNSHNIQWGCRNNNPDGVAVEQWADTANLSLIHDAKLPASFNSSRWKRGYNPDLIFVNQQLRPQCSKIVHSPLPRTQHRPISCLVHAVVKPTQVAFRRRFNFRKANWDKFTADVDTKLHDLDPTPKNYEKFIEIIRRVSRYTIPRGCRTLYVPGLNQNCQTLLKEYQTKYETDPFSEETISHGEQLLQKIREECREKWMDTVTNIDMAKNSKKAWSMLKKLTCNPPEPKSPGQVTANQVAHQVLMNSKPPHKIHKLPKPALASESTVVSAPLTLGELVLAIKKLKAGKAAGVDDLTVEQLKHLGPVALSWMLRLFNTCMESAHIPKLWRKTKIVAILKPGKLPNDPKNFRPIALLCHTYKLFERLLLNRLITMIEPKLIPEQAGFRPGKSCTSQVLRLTQYIEDGYELGKLTGVVLVDLTAAYDTVNVNRLLSKVTTMSEDPNFTRILSEMLRNRRFQVTLNGEKSRWRSIKNGLPQGSVLAPVLFNIYTNDQPSTPETEKFLYADDLALASRASSFENVENSLTDALDKLSRYYDSNALRNNPAKTVSSVFHLRNNQAHRKLKISWRGTDILPCDHPVYLGVTLDRSLTFKNHCLGTKMKVNTRNNLLSRLVSTSWGASPHVLRTTGLALCFSAGEYACPVWHRSTHAREVDVALNDTCRIITGCLRPTPLNMVYPLAGIAPPDVRRSVASSLEKSKQETDTRHPLYGKAPISSRLKSRKSFMGHTISLTDSPAGTRRNKWRAKYSPPVNYVEPSEELPPGHDLPWPTWKSLNRLRTQVGRCRYNLSRWGYADEIQCGCGAPKQDMFHLLSCPSCPSKCSLSELYKATPNAIAVANFWSNVI